MSDDATKATALICNAKGLHARAAAKFVKCAMGFDAQLKVQKHDPEGYGDTSEVSGTSILGLMMLGADKGTTLNLCASGAQASELLEAIQALIADKFGEGE